MSADEPGGQPGRQSRRARRRDRPLRARPAPAPEVDEAGTAAGTQVDEEASTATTAPRVAEATGDADLAAGAAGDATTGAAGTGAVAVDSPPEVAAPPADDGAPDLDAPADGPGPAGGGDDVTGDAGPADRRRPPVPRPLPEVGGGKGPRPLELPAPPVPDLGTPQKVPLDLPVALHRGDRRRVTYGAATVDRANRIVLTVLGLIVGAAGVAGLLLGTGDIHWSRSPGSLYRQGASDAIGSIDVAAAIAMAVCLVVFLLGLRWALVQLRPVPDGPKLGTLRLGDGTQGRITVPSAGVAKAAAADLASRPGIVSARVRLLAALPAPRAVVVVEMAVDADPDQVMEEVSTALGRLARVLQADTVDTDLRIRFGKDLRSAKMPRVR